MACCYLCEGTVLGYRGFPHYVSSPAKSLGVCMDAVGAVLVWEPGVFNLIPASQAAAQCVPGGKDYTVLLAI